MSVTEFVPRKPCGREPDYRALYMRAQDRFERWLSVDPRHRTAFEEAQRLFRMSGKALADKPEEIRGALRKGGRGVTTPC